MLSRIIEKVNRNVFFSIEQESNSLYRSAKGPDIDN